MRISIYKKVFLLALYRTHFLPFIIIKIIKIHISTL